MNRLGRSVLMGTPLLTLDETIERLEAVTREDLEELAQQLYPPAGMSVAAIGRDESLFRGALGARRSRAQRRCVLMIRVAVSGAAGRMGETVCAAVEGADDMELVGARRSRRSARPLEQALRDSSPTWSSTSRSRDTVFENTRLCLEHDTHAVVGTTGLDRGAARASCERRPRGRAGNCLIAPNFAIGAVLMMEAAKLIAPHMPDCEIIELHHEAKLDAPSGTAKRTAELIAEAGGRKDPRSTACGCPGWSRTRK